MTGLFARIWIGILAALAISASVSGFAMKSLMDRDRAAFVPERAAMDLMRRKFESAPPDAWPDILRESRAALPFELELIPTSSVPPGPAADRVRAGDAASMADGGGIRVFVPIGAGDLVLVAGPILPPHRPDMTHFLASIAVTIPIAAAVGFALAFPVVRRLRVLERAAVRIADGDLSARADIVSSDALGRLASRFNTMADEIQRLLESQRHLLAAVSHELRTPISRIHFSLEMLAASSNDPARIAAIETELGELERLIGELLLFCRLDATRQQLSVESFDAGRVLAELIAPDDNSPVGRGETAREVNLEMAGNGDFRITANRRLFERAVRNVLDNARRHATRQVRVRVERAETSVIVEIEDDGPGIAPDDRRRVFDPFVRLDDSRSRDLGGVGLGLAIVQRIMDAHGGTAEVVDRDAPGACLRLRWPSG
ncbi:MAG: HAMP domain-containing protein [Deltaproteobacteria bacterium]|nr:HAMP domain-containing protein [Deltaproteobacteria bacterium]